MKKFIYILVLGLLFSCSEYQKVLNRGTSKEQYKMANQLYDAKKYSKALRLLEKIMPAYRQKPQMERIQFMVAQSYFNNKDYLQAAYHFKRFSQNYSKSSKKEEALFLSAYSYKLASPKYSLDQRDTKKAMNAFQSFINSYPNSSRIEEANKHYEELRFKLEKKAFEIAKTYYRTADYDLRNYKAAIVAFDNLLEEYLGTKLNEEALYYRLKAAHDYVLKSTQRRKPERIKDAISAYDKLLRNFPKTKFLEDSNKMLATLKKEQEQIAKI